MEMGEFRQELRTHGDHGHAGHTDGHFAHAYDRRDPNWKIVIGFSVACVVLLAVTAGGVQLYYYLIRDYMVYNRVLAPEGRDLKALREREDKELYSYGRVEGAPGAVRIPIDRAMELLVTEASANQLRYPTTPYAVKTAQEAGAPLPGAGAVAGPHGGPITAGPAPSELQRPIGQQQLNQPGNTPTKAPGAPPTKQE
jgi:hypothetical protein